MLNFKTVTSPKDTICWHCKEESKYKCPKTQLRYCGLNCYNKLKEDMQSGIIKPTDQLPTGSDDVSPMKAKGRLEEGTAATHTASTQGSVAAVTDTWQKYNDEDDRLSKDKLDLLADSDKIKKLLTNPHLRQMLTFIDSSEDKEKGMENAMKEPIFVEFADACLALVESDSDDVRSPRPTETFVEVKEFELLQF